MRLGFGRKKKNLPAEEGPAAGAPADTTPPRPRLVVSAVSLLGGGLQLLFTMALVPLPGVGMRGYVAGAGAAAVVETALCLWLAVRRAGLRLALFQWLTAPGLAALLAALNANLLLRVLKDNGLSALAAGLVCLLFALVLYLAALHAQGVSLPQALSVGRAKK